MDNEFTKNFYARLKQTITYNKNGLHYDYKTYKGNPIQSILFNELPAMVEIYVKQIPNDFVKNIKIYVEETAINYNTNILPVIKGKNS